MTGGHFIAADWFTIPTGDRNMSVMPGAFCHLVAGAIWGAQAFHSCMGFRMIGVFTEILARGMHRRMA